MSIDYSRLALPKPTRRKTLKARKQRAEKKVKDAVRDVCVERDECCRLGLLNEFGMKDHGYGGQAGECRGASQWAHMHSRRRSKTRGMAPEVRHDTKHSLCLCRYHHQEYDAKRLIITALTRKGADGPLKFTRARTSRESSIPKGRG